MRCPTPFRASLPTVLVALLAFAASAFLPPACPGACGPWGSCAEAMEPAAAATTNATPAAAPTVTPAAAQEAVPPCHGAMAQRADDAVPVAAAKSSTPLPNGPMECCMTEGEDVGVLAPIAPAPMSPTSLLASLPVVTVTERVRPAPRWVPPPPHDPPSALTRLSVLDRWIL